MKTRYYVKITVFFIFLLIIISSCKRNEPSKIKHRDLPEITSDTTLTALTLSGSASYFIYKGEEMGYEYELIKNFAESRNLKLEIKIAENVNRLSEMLQAGEGDVIAYNIPLTNEKKKEIIYCGQEFINEQILVQRSNKGDTILKDVTDLIGKEIWAVKNSKYYNRLVNLNNEIGGGIIIKNIEKDTVTIEDLIGMVANGEIKYTVSDLDIARLNKTYYSNLNINLKISHPQRSSWAVNKTSPQLAEALNDWFKENSNSVRYQSIMKRYFEMSKMPGNEPVELYSKGKISPYDDLFKKYAVQIDWDWRLLASVSYQESKFTLDGESWAGAVGLMGLMPRTAKTFGITPEERLLPEPSIKAGVAYIKALKDTYSEIKENDEKLKFIIAAYNAGNAHILDAQALAKKYGKNPHIWENNVEECLKWKRLPEFYNDSVCKYGYFRGTETLNYVTSVIERWNFYKEKIKDNKEKPDKKH